MGAKLEYVADIAHIESREVSVVDDMSEQGAVLLVHNIIQGYPFERLCSKMWQGDPVEGRVDRVARIAGILFRTTLVVLELKLLAGADDAKPLAVSTGYSLLLLKSKVLCQSHCSPADAVFRLTDCGVTVFMVGIQLIAPVETGEMNLTEQSLIVSCNQIQRWEFSVLGRKI